MNQSLLSNRGRGVARPRPGYRKAESSDASVAERRNGRPTHFISLPLHGHKDLRKLVSSFASALSGVNPAILGVDQHVFIKPQRLHITLGVMQLTGPSELLRPSSPEPSRRHSHPLGDNAQRETVEHTVSDALALLQSLKQDILAICRDCQLSHGRFPIPLQGLNIMGNNRERAHVMWIGPGDHQDDSALWRIATLINTKFRESGFVTDTRPLKLHCTLANSSFRKPRKPFSYNEIIEAIRLNPQIVGGDPAGEFLEAAVDFGTWEIGEIHLCKMGSSDKEGKYISVGHLSLETDS
ncbi:hypothetical protein FRC03_005239 [Tulasnella sp. 419]|nr:hypothetical protein FRC03_005239 [Tulasnella sp. 419]